MKLPGFFTVDLFGWAKPSPINTKLARPFAGQSVEEVQALIKKKREETKELEKLCKMASEWWQLEATGYKAMGEAKIAEHKAVVDIAKVHDKVFKSATKSKREYLKAQKPRGLLM